MFLNEKKTFLNEKFEVDSCSCFGGEKIKNPYVCRPFFSLSPAGASAWPHRAHVVVVTVVVSVVFVFVVHSPQRTIATKLDIGAKMCIHMFGTSSTLCRSELCFCGVCFHTFLFVVLLNYIFSMTSLSLFPVPQPNSLI